MALSGALGIKRQHAAARKLLRLASYEAEQKVALNLSGKSSCARRKSTSAARTLNPRRNGASARQSRFRRWGEGKPVRLLAPDWVATTARQREHRSGEFIPNMAPSIAGSLVVSRAVIVNKVTIPGCRTISTRTAYRCSGMYASARVGFAHRSHQFSAEGVVVKERQVQPEPCRHWHEHADAIGPSGAVAPWR